MTTLDVEYWNGSAWVAVNTLSEGTSALTVDGIITHVPQTDWAKTTVNSVSAYWMRWSEPTTVTSSETYFSIGRQALANHTDYDVDPGAAVTSGSVRNGAVRRIAAGILEDGERAYVSYTYTTFTSQTFGIAETSSLEGSARFEAFPGTGRGRKWSMTIPKAQLVNNGSMDLDDTDFETIPLSLVILDNFDCDPVNPFGTVTVFPHA